VNPNAHKLVANGKKIFVRSAARIEPFENKTLDTPLPPTPVITRWGTWLDVIVHYAENVEIFCSVLNELDRDHETSIAILKDIFKKSNELKVLTTDLVYSHANFNFFSRSTTKLENITNLLSETIDEINDIRDKLNEINGSKADAVKQKIPLMFQ
jgi:hypothetical protein